VHARINEIMDDKVRSSRALPSSLLSSPLVDTGLRSPTGTHLLQTLHPPPPSTHDAQALLRAYKREIELLRARLDAVGPDGGATGGAGMGVGMGMGLLRGVRPQGMLFSSDRDPFDLIEPDEGADDEDGRDRDPEVGTSLPPRALSRPLSVLI